MLVALTLCVLTGCAAPGTTGDASADERAVTGTASAPSMTPNPSPGPSSGPSVEGDDVSAFAPQVRRRAVEAGVDPVLVMAILYVEDYKPHDPTFQLWWQQIRPNASLGVANMHRAAFDDAKRGRAFAHRHWMDLPRDPDLAIRAAAWYLHDLATRLPRRHLGRYTSDELLALGYNTGPANMAAFARGARLGSQAQAYLDSLHDSWPSAERALRDPR